MATPRGLLLLLVPALHLLPLLCLLLFAARVHMLPWPPRTCHLFPGGHGRNGLLRTAGWVPSLPDQAEEVQNVRERTKPRQLFPSNWRACIWAWHDGLHWPRVWVLVRNTLGLPVLPGSERSQPGASGDLHLLPDVLRLHELKAEHPTVQVLCPLWSDAYCRYKHLRLDQNGLQGGDQGHCSLQGGQRGGCLRRFYDQRGLQHPASAVWKRQLLVARTLSLHHESNIPGDRGVQGLFLASIHNRSATPQYTSTTRAPPALQPGSQSIQPPLPGSTWIPRHLLGHKDGLQQHCPI